MYCHTIPYVKQANFNVCCCALKFFQNCKSSFSLATSSELFYPKTYVLIKFRSISGLLNPLKNGVLYSYWSSVQWKVKILSPSWFRIESIGQIDRNLNVFRVFAPRYSDESIWEKEPYRPKIVARGRLLSISLIKLFCTKNIFTWLYRIAPWFNWSTTEISDYSFVGKLKVLL